MEKKVSELSWKLFKADIKANRFIWILLTLIFCFYMAIIISMFDPEKVDTLNDMLDLLPKSLMQAMNFHSFGNTLLTFITGYIYGFLIFLFPMIFSITANHRLISSHIERGSMAFLLSTPNSRIKIALTQAAFSFASISAMMIFTTVFSILISESMFKGQLEIGKFIIINIYALLMYFTIGGIGFSASCIAPSGRSSLGLGIGLPVAFLVFQMIGDASEKYRWIGNLSIYSLFDADRIVEGDTTVIWPMMIFLFTALILYSSAIFIFRKRNLYV